MVASEFLKVDTLLIMVLGAILFAKVFTFSCRMGGRSTPASEVLGSAVAAGVFLTMLS